MIDPGRTHALVVAVEAYEDSDWNVSGPYSDACAFISWLVDGCGVPDTNVTLFASPLPASLPEPEDDPVLPAGVLAQEASSSVLSRHLQEGMGNLEADLLWVFWSGHGLIDSSGSHVLVLADSTVSTKRVVDVDALQLALQSTRLGARDGRGVLKIAVAVNACQNQPREDWISKVEVGVQRSYVTERGLFVMHACSTGQRARIPREKPPRGKAASLFPRALLRFLDDGSRDVLPDLHQVSDRVDAEFEELRKKRLTLQKPSLLRRNWGGRTTATGEFLVPPTAEEEHLAALLDDILPGATARGACAARLKERVPVVVPVSVGARQPTSQQIVTAAARTPHGVSTLLDLLATLPGAEADEDLLQTLREAGREVRPNEFLTREEHSQLVDLLAAPGAPDPRATALYDGRLRHLVDDTGDSEALLRSMEASGCRTGARLIPQLFRFTSLLAAEAETQSGDDMGLVEWSTRVAQRTGHAGALAARLATARREAARRRGAKAWLLVRLDVDDPEARTGGARYTHSAWLIDPVSRHPQTLPSESGKRLSTWRQTQVALAELIEPFIDMRHEGSDGQVDLGVEFFLPNSQLELQVERLPVCHRGVDNIPLGHLTTVVVRCAGRRTAWHHRWNACQRNKAPGAHHWLQQDAHDLAALKAALDGRPNIACVELSGHCAEFTPALAYCVQAGVPVMTWHRRIDGERRDDDLAELRIVHPRHLPEEVRQLRSEADGSSVPGSNHLVLLWDDPARLPPRIRPQVPGRIPQL
ncbi:VMAP-C domain-containing protein [Streptomyces chartreusis]|uniref:VMAP-C domain-containing protein n=1 Tax=Streptomyces chartreusis TaxID=1969 RepID=UPI0036A0794A